MDQQGETEVREESGIAAKWCAVCGEPIPAGRLQAVPETVLCLKHAKEADTLGGEFKLSVADVKTSKSGSLKKNFGGVDVTRRANGDVVDRLRARHSGGNGHEVAPAKKTDRFGAVLGSPGAAFNAVLRYIPLTVGEIAGASGYSMARARGRLRRFERLGLVREEGGKWVLV